MTVDGERASAPLRRRLYGRSRGKALRPGQERLLADTLPKVEVAPDAVGRPGLFPFEPDEVWLEIGFGSGEHLIDQAKANPGVGFIGCEPFLNGVAAALAGIEREKLANVRLRRGDAQALVESAPDAFFSRVFILYPDPWPKRRHHKRRVISDAMIAALARVMQAGRRTALRDRHRRLRRLDACGDFSLRPISAGWLPAPTIGGPPGRIGVRRAMKPRRSRAGRGSVYLTFVRM